MEEVETTTLGNIDDYLTVDDDDVKIPADAAWSAGKPSGTVQHGFIKDANDPEMLAHHLKGMELSRQVEEMQVPRNENIWKVVMTVAEPYLTERDKLNLRLVCHDSKRVADNYIRFSQKQFDELIHKMNKDYAGQNLTDWQQIEKDLEALIAANGGNPKFRQMMTEWIELMDPPSVTTQVAEQRLERSRPGFRKGFKKIGRAAAGSASAIGAVVTLPLAILSVPLLFSSSKGVQTGGMLLAAPFGLAVTYAAEKFGDAIHVRNLRDIPDYVKMRQCIARVKVLLAQSSLPQ
jgi:hypothetical protein